MIKATIIFGEAAVDRYDSTNKIPSQRWLDNNIGSVEKKEFCTEGEYNAYVEGLRDSSGWAEYCVIKQEDTTNDCMEEKSIWMRLGITLSGSQKDIEKVLAGDEPMLAKLLKKNKFEY